MNPADLTAPEWDLAAWRKAMGWSQPRLAEALGVHPMTVSAWERGTQDFPPYLRLALSKLEEA